MSQQVSDRYNRPVWASPVAVITLWAAVVALAVVGVMAISVNGDLGGLLFLTALVLAAPAQAAGRLQSRA